jgi:hypothetical protein
VKSPADIQQCLPSFNTVQVVAGPLVVRVHKAKDVIYADSNRHGFFISVDFKFRQLDAENIGNPGWEGFSKTEATREANRLAAAIAQTHATMTSAHEQALNWDTSTNRITERRQADRFNAVAGRYVAELS